MNSTVNAIQVLMEKYEENKQKWISYYGTKNGFNEWFSKQIAINMEDDMDTVKLSKMNIGDKGYLENEAAIVQLKKSGKSGGAENDLYLAYVCDVREAEEEYPAIIVDTDNVSL